MKNKIFYKKSVSKDLKRISHSSRMRIMTKIDIELSKVPTPGKKLKGEFNDLSSYRIGDYRVIYTVFPEGVLIVGVNHRKESYGKNR